MAHTQRSHPLTRPPVTVRLNSARCQLRRSQPADAPALFEATRNAEFIRWLGWSRPRSLKEVERRLSRMQRQWHEGSYALTALLRGHAAARGDGPRIVGGIDLKPDAFLSDEDVLNLGYWTHPHWQNRGFGTEFVCCAISWAFELGIEGLVAGVALENTPSHRLLRRLGFRPFEQCAVRTRRQAFLNVRYYLTRSQWRVRGSRTAGGAADGGPQL